MKSHWAKVKSGHKQTTDDERWKVLSKTKVCPIFCPPIYLSVPNWLFYSFRLVPVNVPSLSIKM